MKKYFLKQIIKTTDGKYADEDKYVFDNRTMTDKERLDEAMKRFHLMMGANMNEPKVTECSLFVIEDDGLNELSVKHSETFRRTIEPQAE